jgi:hypothetical protein
MAIPNDELSKLTTDVLARSTEFAMRIQSRLPAVLFDVGHYSNDASLLRSYVSRRAENDGDEVAMTVEVTARPTIDQMISVSIESDICMDDGTIIATGPSATIVGSAPADEAVTSTWSKEFDAFLSASEHRVLGELEEMISKKNKVESRTRVL